MVERRCDKYSIAEILANGGPPTRGPRSLSALSPDVSRSPPRRDAPPRFGGRLRKSHSCAPSSTHEERSLSRKRDGVIAEASDKGDAREKEVLNTCKSASVCSSTRSATADVGSERSVVGENKRVVNDGESLSSFAVTGGEADERSACSDIVTRVDDGPLLRTYRVEIQDEDNFLWTPQEVDGCSWWSGRTPRSAVEPSADTLLIAIFLPPNFVTQCDPDESALKIPVKKNLLSSTAVTDVKRTLESRLGIPAEWMTLRCEGEQLNDHFTLDLLDGCSVLQLEITRHGFPDSSGTSRRIPFTPQTPDSRPGKTVNSVIISHVQRMSRLLGGALNYPPLVSTEPFSASKLTPSHSREPAEHVSRGPFDFVEDEEDMELGGVKHSAYDTFLR